MASTREGPVRSRKGEREATRLLDAATDVLAREGYGGATLGRIAAEADVDKKMVVYYFGSRDSLLAKVVGRVGDRLAANTAMELAGVSEPREMADLGIDQLWAGTTEFPELLRAYLALATSAVGSEPVEAALETLKAEFVGLFGSLIDVLESAGHPLRMPRDAYLKLVLACWRGLALEWVETGDTPGLASALEEFKRITAAPFD